uniref:Protein kinase domain-containing protein n=1 Tax=Moniliophthora roreri TaxID=221103 RepID=A0A0W0FYB0_MONRR
MPTFFIDYRKIMLAYAILWLLGVEHGDISEANLRFCTKTSWLKLCDWDLSHFTGEPRPAGFTTFMGFEPYFSYDGGQCEDVA